MITVEDAIEIVLSNSKIIDIEDCPIRDTLGRILASSILAPHDQPPWDNSAMDGYAVRWEDIQAGSEHNPVTLRKIEVIPAGQAPRFPLNKGECSKIMTGARIPTGADTVVPVEVTNQIGEEILILKTGSKNDHIRLKGEDVQKGKTVLKKGKRIRPSEISMLASLGILRVPVFKKPIIAVLSTGNELTELNEKRSENKIFNSNGYALCALAEECGGFPLDLGIAQDSKDALLKKLQEGESADILVVSGGVSMGDFDYVREVLGAYGKIKFWRTAMRPGSPVAFGEYNGKPFFGLPGNPVSCMVTFKLFVEPLVKKMGGASLFRSEAFPAILDQEIHKKKGLRSFLRGVIFNDRQEIKVKLTGEQGSHLIHSMVEANCLIDVPEELEHVEEGKKIMVIPLDSDFSH
ncbi:MAG: gephyrin-like molybdotransferase Glp [Nitrospiria bacterium]